jgi:hypothetical protein
MIKYLNALPKFAVALSLVAAAPISWSDDDEDEIPFSEAKLFFELNNTDGDLGIHALIDGDPWKHLKIEDPRERGMLNVSVRGRLRRQGLTEIFFESAEPTFDELTPKRFFRRFPEGTYEVEGRTLEGDELESEMLLTHVIPAPPGGVTLNATADPLDEGQCDDEDPAAFDPPEVTLVDDTVTIEWGEVTMSHPEIVDGPGVGLGSVQPVDIYNYEVVVEVELDSGFTSVMHVVLPPEETALTLPVEFVAQGDEFKYEILAREVSYNQTATESCFELDEYNGPQPESVRGLHSYPALS